MTEFRHCRSASVALRWSYSALLGLVVVPSWPGLGARWPGLPLHLRGIRTEALGGRVRAPLCGLPCALSSCSASGAETAGQPCCSSWRSFGRRIRPPISAGGAWGGPKLWPSVLPKKTWSGRAHGFWRRPVRRGRRRLTGRRSVGGGPSPGRPAFGRSRRPATSLNRR
jgi:hypothetical protein